MKTELLAVVSDLHCGSNVGIAPPETETDSGNIVGFGKNHHQHWLWDNWLSAIEKAKAIIGASSCVLVVNGDAVEGVHHRNEAELLAAKIETHVKMAEMCLAPLQKLVKKTYVVKGTECHTRDMENLLAERIGAESGIARDKWLIEINGCLIDAAHHMTTSGRAYLEASAMSILMGNARLNYLRAGHRVPDIFLRAHRHCGGYYSDSVGLFCVTGAWQMLTRFGFKAVTDSIPRCSLLLLDFRGKKSGALPLVENITFNPPQNEIFKA